MNIGETSQALGLAQAFDLRTVGEMDVRAWHSVLGDLAADDVYAAIRLHYTESTDRIMPAHIRRRVDGWKTDRQRANQATGWAPGQAGVPKDQAAPEVVSRGRLALGDLPKAVADLVAQVRADLPEGSREALMPRRVAWEREHAAYRRSQGAAPNPLYRPGTVPRSREECPFCMTGLEGQCPWHREGGEGAATGPLMCTCGGGDEHPMYSFGCVAG